MTKIKGRDRDQITKHLRTLFGLGALGSWTDAKLLDLYLEGNADQAEAAFSALVDRHGRMVARVCRSILHDEHDTQDAFQATFLVLARRAGSIRRADSVAPWLFGVARRVAQQAKTRAARNREVEQHKVELDKAQQHRLQDKSTADPARSLDAWADLHEEIARLPDRYRAPIVLCYLEGLAHEQAARLLGCPVPTLRTRLTRARKRLRDRLTRRGLAPALGLLAFESVAKASIGHATLPVSIGATARVAQAARAVSFWFSTSQPTAKVSATVATLARTTSWSLMMTSPFRFAAVGCLALLATGAGFGFQANTQQSEDDREKPVVQRTEIPEKAPAQGRLASIRSEVPGEPILRYVVADGTKVFRNQLVCELDTAPLRSQLNELEEKVDLARARLTRAFKALQDQEINAREYLEGIYPQQLNSIEAEIKLYQSELDRAEDRLKLPDVVRLAELRDPQVQAQSIADRYAKQKAEFSLQQARQKLEVLQHYTKPKQVKALLEMVENARAEMVARKADLRILENETVRLQRFFKQRRISIVAHHEGILKHSEIQPLEAGDIVHEGRLLFHIDAMEEEEAERDNP
ncbi:hypothetical protein BH23PLA1_BH23PLA1_34810 [soil metagenome]